MEIETDEKIYQNPLLVFALKSEAEDYFNDWNTAFVGVGKINAVFNLIKTVQHDRPDCIVNLGTAGSTTFNRGEVVCCTQFIQRDMDVAALGFQKFQTPFSEESIVLDYGLKINGLKEGICGSGDQFETEHKNPEYNVIDMEAYALAWVAKQEKIPFLCLKYISDGADGNAVEDWQAEVKNAAQKLHSVLHSISND
ncbi:phosphorylase family protein [Daejeonia sp. YH14]|uniref:5'-methylthioadenosine/S-adenosylhomocysteine nucleosidase family protein n=1 Tax=Daejeonia sp. YH14 TaxID=3439042 RepID=UPI003F499754